MTIVKDTVNVHTMLNALYDLTQEWARSQKIEVQLTCPPDIGFVQVDERRMKQVLLNLIRNAIDFTPAGGRIMLGAKRHADGIELSVTDTGPGIDLEDQERVFKPFERTDAPRDDGDGNARGGAGLGLTLVKNIVDMHDGTVELDSAKGRGTTMRIRLPA